MGWTEKSHLQSLRGGLAIFTGSAQTARSRRLPVGGSIKAVSVGCGRSARLAIAGCEVNTLVDSGAARTLTAVETCDKLCRTVNRSTLLSPKGVVCALGGQPFHVIGEREIE